MHNITTYFDIIRDKIKPSAKNLLNPADNLPRRGVKPKFSDLQVLALALTAEALAINEFYEKLNTKNNSTNFPNLLCG